eukprot:8546188-Alexandrium_andersonii.AAC.1
MPNRSWMRSMASLLSTLVPMSASFSVPLRLATAKRCLATRSCTNSWRTAKCLMRPGPRRW